MSQAIEEQIQCFFLHTQNQFAFIFLKFLIIKINFRAADYLVRTGTVVSLEVAKQGAIYDGLATLLQQPSPVIQRGKYFLTI